MNITKKFRLLFSVIITSIVLIFTSTSVSKAQNILFQDNFDDGNAIGWDVVGSSGWNVQNNEYGIRLSPGLSNSIPNDSIWDYQWTNIVYEVDIRGTTGVDKNILVKFVNSSNFIELHAYSGGIVLEKASTSGGGGILASNGIILSNNRTYHFKFEISNNQRIKVYMDESLMFDVNERLPLLINWKVGLRAGTGGVPTTEVWFDNVVVRGLSTATPTPIPTPTATPTPSPTPTPIPLPSLNVPDLKQYSSPWNDDIYDHATNWSSDPTIEHWGCAVTSAAMVLKYHGHNAYPDTLNNWLTSQLDGYLRNGLLNWLAISRYSYLNSNAVTPALEYRRLGASTSSLINELENDRPAILKEPGHFIVAKSQTPNSFGINDPAYANRTTLASYNNSFEAINSFRPTHTDLSYLLLAADPVLDVSVTDPNGNPISGATFTDAPITDPINSNQSGTPLKIFTYPTPTEGNYQITISGDDLYQLDSYVYEEDGGVTLSSISGFVSSEQDDNLTLEIGTVPTLEPEVSIPSVLEDLYTAYSQELITKKQIYQLLAKMLVLADTKISQGNIKTARQIIKVVILQVKIFTPAFINPEASKVLQDELSVLVSEL